MSPAELLQWALESWPQFNPASSEYDEEVNGGDMVEWFGEFREQALIALGLPPDSQV